MIKSDKRLGHMTFSSPGSAPDLGFSPKSTPERGVNDIVHSTTVGECCAVFCTGMIIVHQDRA